MKMYALLILLFVSFYYQTPLESESVFLSTRFVFFIEPRGEIGLLTAAVRRSTDYRSKTVGGGKKTR